MRDIELIPYGHQSVDDADVAAVDKVLRGDWLTQGPSVGEFEDELCRWTGARYAVALSSGTAALHAACAVAGLGPGDRVGTSTLSFAASANCARYVGATPVLCDIDPATLNMAAGTLPGDLDAIVAVHFAGLPVDLRRLARRPRVVIEDAAHALGAITPDGPVGNCARSDMCCFSFHPVKIITTGEGGAVTTNDPDLADGLRRFRSHGIVRTPEIGGWAYDIAELGFNYRLTDIQAALGTSQLARLERFVERRRFLADRYRDLLRDAAVVLPPAAAEGFLHAYHLFVVQVEERRQVYDAMHAAGIGVQVHYRPIHQLSISVADDGPTVLTHADRAAERILSLPLFPELTEAAQDRVVAVLAQLVGSRR